MPKKRTSAESNNDEPTNGGSESLHQRDCDAKRQKLDSTSDTMLQDLPIELLESILVKVVVMEVKRWKLAKNAWEDKADLVIRRLGTVCTQWNNILTTKFFWNELQRTLDNTAQGEINLEITQKSPIQTEIISTSSLKDDVFMLCNAGQDAHGNFGKDFAIEVYDRNNMAEVKEVIPIPGADFVVLMACSVSNCVYAVMRIKNCDSLSVLRISKNAKQKFIVSPWVFDRTDRMTIPYLSPNGNLLAFSILRGQGPAVMKIDVYNGDGSLQHTVTVPSIDAVAYMNVVQKSNGNLILCYVDGLNFKLCLMEFDMSGTIVRHYQSSADQHSCVDFADRYGRIIVTDLRKNIELLDSEFNLVAVYATPHRGQNFVHSDFHYDSERNEIVRVFYDKNTKTRFLSTLRFTEE